jgi:hypothetical protein
LASLTWWACQQAALPEDVRLNLCRAYYAGGDAELHRRELAHILHQFNGRQIQAIVFKGAALAYRCIPIRGRTMGDIDVWVAGEDIEQRGKR